MPGLAHLSAPTAPAALVAGAPAGGDDRRRPRARSRRDSRRWAPSRRANHPAMRARGWHPTAVCGDGGRGGGGRAAAGRRRGARAARLARCARAACGPRSAPTARRSRSAWPRRRALAGGAARGGRRTGRRTRSSGAGGFEAAYGAPLGAAGRAARRSGRTGSRPIPAACRRTARSRPPRRRERPARARTRAARSRCIPSRCRRPSLFDVEDGLQAKFSIPYLTAFTLLHGPPDRRELPRGGRRCPPRRARARAARDRRGLRESEAVLSRGGRGVPRRGRARIAGPPDGPSSSWRTRLASWPGRGSTECSTTSRARRGAWSRRPGWAEARARPAAGARAGTEAVKPLRVAGPSCSRRRRSLRPAGPATACAAASAARCSAHVDLRARLELDELRAGAASWRSATMPQPSPRPIAATKSGEDGTIVCGGSARAPAAPGSRAASRRRGRRPSSARGRAPRASGRPGTSAREARRGHRPVAHRAERGHGAARHGRGVDGDRGDHRARAQQPRGVGLVLPVQVARRPRPPAARARAGARSRASRR